MRYGHFDDQNREYVITDFKTPYPWINYLGNQDFFSIISNTAGGYSFYKDARMRRITRYRYNNVPLDNTGKYFYIHDEGDIWSPTWKPVRIPLVGYQCRHGLGYTMISAERNAMRAEVTYFVPQNFNGEVQRVRLKNLSAKEKSIRLFSLVEWCLWNALDDMTNFQRNLSTGEVEVDGTAIYHKTEYKERRNHYAFYAATTPIDGFDTDRDTFLGMHNGYDTPEAVKNGTAFNSLAHGWSPIASHMIKLDFKPGEEKEVVFVLGYVENPEDQKWEKSGVINKEPARAMINKFSALDAVDEELKVLKNYWHSLLNNFQVQTNDQRLDRMVNTWNQYQCMITFCMSRSASYFESGIGRGMGFRDSNQDLIGFVHQVPEKARDRILDIAATQFEDGGAYHQYQPLTKKGNNEIGSNFNDDPLWLILSTTEYIKETGDFSILDEQVPFDNDESKSKSLFEHLTRSFDHVINNLGPHQLPLIGRADWNDCLNLNCFSTNPDESFQTTENKAGETAESLFIAAMFILYGNEYIQLCNKLGKMEEASRAAGLVKTMKNTVMQHGWDGEWFLRAYDDSGNKIGSKENEEGKIFIETQGFCVMAGLGIEDGKASIALNAVKRFLDSEYGIALLYPAFTKYHLNMGEISTYPAGYKENAGIFCHNNPWVMIAETMLGHGEQAFEYYRKISPSYLEEISDLHKTEPYVYSQMIAGKEAVKPGEAKNSWLTGTAAWNYYAITQYILGIKPDYDGLIIDPCIPPNWEEFTVRRRFRDSDFEIQLKNPQGVSKGISKILLNGKPVNGNKLPVLAGKHRVEVIMGQ